MTLEQYSQITELVDEIVDINRVLDRSEIVGFALSEPVNGETSLVVSSQKLRSKLREILCDYRNELQKQFEEL